jgi:hypothetical protein
MTGCSYSFHVMAKPDASGRTLGCAARLAAAADLLRHDSIHAAKAQHQRGLEFCTKPQQKKLLALIFN